MAPESKPKPVKPILGAGSRARISPQSRFDAYLQDLQERLRRSRVGNSEGATLDEVVTDVVRSRVQTPTTNTLNMRAVFVVDELIYPGDQTQPPLGQYVYVFSLDRHGDLLVEALCGEEGWDQKESKENARIEWFYRVNDYPKHDPYMENTLTPETRGVLRSKVVLPVPGLVEGEKIAFFLSPIPLTRAARQIVANNIGSTDATKHGSAVRPIWGFPSGYGPHWSSKVGYVAVPEPAKWAAAAHDKWFLPEVAAFRTWEAERDADMFVASVLESWRGPLKLDSKLRPSGDVREAARRLKVDERPGQEKRIDDASLYCLNMIDTQEHRAVDASSGKQAESMIWMAAHWSHVLGAAAATRQGRRLIAQIARGLGFGKDTLPHKLVVQDDWPSAFTFAQGRYLAIAIHDAAAAIYPYVKNRERWAFVRRVERLDKPAKVGLGIIEIVNFYKAFSEWKKENSAGDADWYKHLGLAGAGADLLSGSLFQALESSIKSSPTKVVTFLGGKTAMRIGVGSVLAGVFAVAGMVGDVAEFSPLAGTAWAEEDWSRWAGASMATFGAGLNGLAGLSLWILGEGAVLFAWAPYLLAIGGVLLLMGSLVSGMKDNPYEEFAMTSRFGVDRPLTHSHGGYGRHTHPGRETPLYRRWAHEPLGTRNREKEMKTLIGMMCAFSVRMDTAREDSPDTLRIHVGYTPPGSVFEIKVKVGDLRNDESKWIRVDSRPTDKDEEEFQSFSKQIIRDEKRFLREIQLRTPRPRIFRSARVRLVMQPNGFQVPAENGRWVEVGSNDAASSFDVDKWA